VMLESFLVAGRQEPGDPATLTYGQSVTDACLDIDMTAATLETLAASIARRRQLLSALSRVLLVAGDAVDPLAQQVGVPVVPRVLLDHVEVDPPQVQRLAAQLERLVK
jgi:hypothetical protein